MHVQMHMEKTAYIWIKIDTIENRLEDTDKGEKIVIQKDIKGPIQLINYSSEKAVIY